MAGESARIPTIARAGAQQLADTLAEVDEVSLDSLLGAVRRARATYVLGAGRSLLMLRPLAMRLMHVGLTSHVVGDTTTPKFEAADLLIVASGSGGTASVLNAARIAKKAGGTVAAFTISPASELVDLADIVVRIPAYSDKGGFEEAARPVLPGGGLFEQSVLLLGDALIVPLAAAQGISTEAAFPLHANIE
ncbi:MAG: 6-phospho-3-hexuloisomerase [Propioniciclava sp.]